MKYRVRNMKFDGHARWFGLAPEAKHAMPFPTARVACDYAREAAIKTGDAHCVEILRAYSPWKVIQVFRHRQ